MVTNGLTAWILHKQNSGETSAWLIFFTREAGLLRCLCKGGRTPKKQALLQPFNPLWFVANKQYVQRIESIAQALQLQGDALFSGLYVNELLSHALVHEEPYPDLFDAYSETLHHLQTATNSLQLEATLRRFEWTLLQTLGYGMTLTHEVNNATVIHKDNYYQFIAGKGLIKAQTGFLGEHLLALAKDDLEDKHTLQTAKRLMRIAIHHLLGGVEIQTRKLYSSGFTL
jgi:DNA repair protein RecO (recombination protein O)